MFQLDEQVNKPPIDNSLEEEIEEEKHVEFDRTADEIEGENLTKDQPIEHDEIEQHPTARFVDLFLI